MPVNVIFVNIFAGVHFFYMFNLMKGIEKMYCFVLFKMSVNSDTLYARLYHYSNDVDLECRLKIMKHNGNIILDTQKEIDNFLVATL